MNLRRPIQMIIFFLSTSGFAQNPGDGTQDIGWPRQVTQNGNTLTYYQPQLDSWQDYKELKARAAISLVPKGGKEVLGVADFDCQTLVDKDTRLVYLRSINIPAVRFPSLSPDSAKMMENLFRQLIPMESQPISLDRIMADLQQDKKDEKGVQLKNDPPPIFYSNSPAILLMVEGDSVLAPIEKLDVEFVVNCNWDLFRDKKKKDYYLLTNNGWMTAKQLKGPWSPTQSLPKDMSKLPSGQNFDDVKKFVPPPPPSGTVPHVFFTSVPGELVLLKAAPIYSPIKGTNLLYITNTDNDLFVDNSTKTFYVLLSGRWFSSKSLSGPWEYAGDKLPKDFSKIPDSSPKAHVLASVPGTVEASDAVMLAQIPQTAIVNKAEAEAKVKVTYDGDPKFSSIENTSLQYATNTQDKIIKDGDLYYLCFQGVWFMSTSPNGPWKTCDSVPKEIYSIPPSSPVYNVTYVTQTNATATTVESSSTAGYFGMFVIGMAFGAAIAYGTGWYHPPYMYFGPMYPYPIYRPWPCAYGAGVVYNPWTGGFAGGRVAYGPYGAARTSAWYNPATGRYGRSATVQTPWGGRSAASAYNPWTGGYANTRQGHNAYGQWGSSVASRGNQWVQTGHVTTAAGTTAGYRTSTGQAGIVHSGAAGTTVRTNNGNVYAGHDGNVYKKDAGGGWSQYNNNGNWNKVNNNTASQQRLDGTEQARNRGQQQSQRFQNFQRGGGGRGGGFRGRR
ncbi:MAG: hypothetical protein C5B59_15740 [Bacteroidetes bacterium]|nr:MAG: hypothetical protein C5B59_15740 [Bacteroidota bacterium]